MAQFPFVGPTYALRSRNFDAQRTINLYPVLSESGTSASPAMLLGTPGLRRVLTVGDGPIRGLYRTSTSWLLVASGWEIYRVSRSLNATYIGTIAGAGPVAMTDNGKHVLVACGSASYIVDLTTWGIKDARQGVYQGTDRVGYLDGRMLWNVRGTGRFMWTDLHSTEFSALNFATAEASPDSLVSLIVDHRELWLFGQSSTEVWYSTGDPNAAVEPIRSAFIEHGCAAPHSVDKLDNTVFWLGADDRGHGIVWRANGYTPARISNHAIEYAISRCPRVDDAIGFAYQQDGHSFYVLTFPSGGLTVVFDVATGMWHERAWRHPETGELGRWRANCHAAFADMNLVGDCEDGRIYALDLDYYTDDGDAIARVRTAPHLSDDMSLTVMAELRVDFETGVGLATGQGSAPLAMLEVSKDGGHSWSNRREVSLGRIGETRARAIWRRLGQGRDWVFRVTVTDPVPVRIIGASVRSG